MVVQKNKSNANINTVSQGLDLIEIESSRQVRQTGDAQVREQACYLSLDVRSTQNLTSHTIVTFPDSVQVKHVSLWPTGR